MGDWWTRSTTFDWP